MHLCRIGQVHERENRMMRSKNDLKQMPVAVCETCLCVPREPFKRETANLATGATKGTRGVLVSRSLTLPFPPPSAGGVIR